MSLVLFFAARHVLNASTFIFRSLRLCVGILLWLDACWRYGVVRLGWCGILMQAKAKSLACIRIYDIVIIIYCIYIYIYIFTNFGTC